MCMDESCVPVCERVFTYNSDYCKNKRDEISKPKETPKPVMETPCAQGDTFIAGSGDGLMCWLGGLLGIECKTERQKAEECADYRTHTTGKSYYVNTTCENISDGLPPVVMSCYHKVIEGVR